MHPTTGAENISLAEVGLTGTLQMKRCYISYPMRDRSPSPSHPFSLGTGTNISLIIPGLTNLIACLPPSLQHYRIRVLDADKFKETKQLQEDCQTFTQKIQQLNDMVKGVVDVVDGQVRQGRVDREGHAAPMIDVMCMRALAPLA